MANEMLHIKDSYYFELPKFMVAHSYPTLNDVPEFLRNAHPEITDPKVFEQELAGKVLIPQPFGELQNLYERKSGFAISKYMIIELVVAVIIAAIFIRVAGKIATGERPRGRFWNFFESMLMFVRNEIAEPAIGHHDAHRFLPILWTMFFFILGCNLMGMLPWAGSPTASFAVTLAMALVTFGTVFIFGTLKFGVVGFWLNQIPHMDLHWSLSPVKVMIFAIEVIGLGIKHGVLAIRLLANMVAGHLVLLGIMGMIAGIATFGSGMVTAIVVVGSVLLSILELFVAFLQAYIFTFLSALFIGAAVHKH